MDKALSFALGPLVEAWTVIGVGSEGAHVQQAVDVVGAAGIHHLLRELDMGVMKAAAIVAFFVKDPHKIDHDITTNQCLAEGRRIMNIALDHRKGRKHQQVTMGVAFSCQDAHLVTSLVGQVCTKVVADEAASPKDAYRMLGHGGLHYGYRPCAKRLGSLPATLVSS